MVLRSAAAPMPRYIAIEGPRGCGKSSLLERLPQRLQVYGVKVAVVCPTPSTPVPPPQEWLAAAGDDDALRERLPEVGSSFHAAQVPHDAHLILGDCSILTSVAARLARVPAGRMHPCSERDHAMESLIGLPDHVLLLEVPEEQLLIRQQARHPRNHGKHDEAREHLRGALAAYHEMRERGDELGLGAIVWHHIDADAAPNVVLARAVVRILEILGSTAGEHPAITLRRSATSSARADQRSLWTAA